METKTLKQINSSEYIDLDGNFIGDIQNLVFSQMRMAEKVKNGLRSFIAGESIDVKKINDKINTYLAARYCYDGDTSNEESALNNVMKQYDDFAKIIGYKPIK